MPDEQSPEKNVNEFAADRSAEYDAESSAVVTEPPAPDQALRRRSRIAVAKYGLARLGLFVALTAVIQGIVVLVDAPVPLIVSAMLALFVALPLSMLVFTKWRVEAVETLARYSAQRKAHKAWVQQELAGR